MKHFGGSGKRQQKIPAGLKSMLTRSTGLLTAKMQDYLWKQVCAVASGKKNREDAAVAEARELVAIYQNRVKQFSQKGGARSHDKGMFHPSSISVCQRAQWYKMLEAPKEPVGDAVSEARGQAIFSNGDHMHARLQALLKCMGVLKMMEVPFSNAKEQWEGHADAIVELDGELYVVDFKSINSRGFAEVRKSGVKSSHRDQLTVYMGELGIPKGIVLYENKDTQEWFECEVNFDSDLFVKLRDRKNAILKAIKTLKPPAREGDSAGSFPCNWCNFRSVCWNSKRHELWAKSLAAPAPSKKPKLKVRLVLKRK